MYEGYVAITRNGQMVKFGVGPLKRANATGVRCFHVYGPRTSVLLWERACLRSLDIPRLAVARSADSAGYTEVRYPYRAIRTASEVAHMFGLDYCYDHGAYLQSLGTELTQR